jgi:hypothetical protein
MMKSILMPFIAGGILFLMSKYIPEGLWKCWAFYLAGMAYMIIYNWEEIMSDPKEPPCSH